MRAASNKFDRAYGEASGIRQEQKILQNREQVKEIKRSTRRTRKLNSLVSMVPYPDRTCQHSPKALKIKRGRRTKKPYITTNTVIQEQPYGSPVFIDCSETLDVPTTPLMMREERDCESLPSSSSTPRGHNCAEPRGIKYSESVKYPTHTNPSLNGSENVFTPHQILEPKLGLSSIPFIGHNIKKKNDCQTMGYHQEIAPQQAPILSANVYSFSHSTPELSQCRSKVENYRRQSDPNRMCWRGSTLDFSLSSDSEKPSKERRCCDSLILSEAIESPSERATIDTFSAPANASETYEYFQSSLRHDQHDSSTSELILVQHQWQCISRMRSDISALRQTLQILRVKLRALRDEKSLADDAYFKEVKMRELDMPFPRSWWPEKTLTELLCDSQKARDKYGPLEDEYDHLEQELTSKEYQLSRQEEQFYYSLRDPLRLSHSCIEPGKDGGLSEEPQHLEPRQSHPLVGAYLSKLGDLDILFEYYDDILEEKLSLEEHLATRKRFNMNLMPEDQQWLDSSQAQLDDLTSKIQIAKMEEKDLRQQCFSLDLVDEHGNPKVPSMQEQPDEISGRTSKVVDNIQGHIQKPLDLSSKQTDPITTLIALDSEHTRLARNERFDRWSLEKLQSSLVEIDVYANCSQDFCEVRDLKHLQDHFGKKDFVNTWYTDGFTKNAPRSTGITSYHSSAQSISPADLNYSKPPSSDVVFSQSSSFIE